MKRATVILIAATLAAGAAHAQVKPRASRVTWSTAPCGSCTAQTPLLDSGRPPLPGEEGSGVQSCSLINTRADWDAYCNDNVVPDCPLLDDAFFAENTVVAVAIDTVTTRPCEGSPDPLWSLDCIGARRRMVGVRVVEQRPGSGCLCSAIPQRLQRLFLASAVPKTRAGICHTCEEGQTIGCLR